MGDSGGPSDSQVGDDPSTFDDEGVGYGNVDTTTQQFQEDTRQENQRSNIIGDPNYDAQFTADRIENQFGEGTAKNFMSPDTYAQTTQAARDSGLPSVSIDIPSIQAASSNLAPGILGETLSDFQSGVRSGPQVDRDVVDVGAQNMLEAAIASRPRDFSNLDLIPTTGFLPAQVTVSDQTGPGTQAAIAATLNMLDQNRNRRAGLGDPQGIDFGVTQQLLPATTPTARPENLRQRFDNAAIQEALEAGTLAENLDRSNITETALGARTPGTIPTEEIDDLADTEFARPRETGTTATGTTGTFDPEAENLMDSTFLDTTPYKEGTAVADIKLRDAPFDENLNLFGLQIPNLAGRALNFGAEKLNDRLFDRIVKKPSGEVLRDKDGRIIGVMDETNSFLIEGMPGLDSKGQMRGQMQEEQGGDNEPQRKVAPKAPTDPCPDGYQLIDGKCTPTGATDTGTGFMMFPTDRTPPFRTGPFTPTTVATNPNIRALNPVTFGLSNIFRR